MAIVFQLGSGPQVRRSASRASSPSRTRSQTRRAYGAPVPADHGADVTGGIAHAPHQSHRHHGPRERVLRRLAGSGTSSCLGTTPGMPTVSPADRNPTETRSPSPGDATSARITVLGPASLPVASVHSYRWRRIVMRDAVTRGPSPCVPQL